MNRIFRTHVVGLLAWLVTATVIGAQGVQTPTAPAHQRNASEFVTLVLGGETGVTRQQSQTLTDIQPTLDMLRAVGGQACATVIQDRLSTPMFVRDEIAKSFADRVNPDALGRVLVLTRAMAANPSEADEQAAVTKAYPGVTEPTDRMRMAMEDLNTVKTAYAVSLTDAGQIREHYCKGMVGGPNPAADIPTALGVSCDTTDYQVLSVAQPPAGETAWRVRYRHGDVTGTWKAEPSSRGFTIGGTHCEFDWQ